MRVKKTLALTAASLIGMIGLGWQLANNASATTNEGENPISKVATTGFNKKQVLEVNNQPFFYNGVQIRIDKLRDKYGYNMDQIRDAFKQAKSDGFTVVNSQILWSDVQPDQSLTPSDIAYVKNGNESNKNFDESNTSMKLVNDGSNQSLVYLKYDLSKLDQSKFKAGKSDGVKLRIYAKSDSTAKLNVYGLDQDNNWNKDTTWKDAPFKGTGMTKLISSPNYDPIKKENYYDLDVTKFVNKQNAGKVTLALQAQSGTSLEVGGGAKIGTQTHLGKPLNETPQLVVSNKDNYDYNYLDQVIKAARDAGIKLELLWFGSDTTKETTEHRVPYYVAHDYTLAKKSDGSLLGFKKSAPTEATGQYVFNLDKNDSNLQKQEATALKNVFNHVAENNQQNGDTDTVIGAQMPNEPTNAKSYTQPSLELQKKLNMSDSDFKTWTLWNYTNNLDAAVKTSQYPVWTRVNNAANDGGSAIVALNEEKRASTNASTSLDAVGLDDYQADYQSLYNYGHSKPYANGDNIPMIMEDGMGSDSSSWAAGNYTPLDAGLRTITALAGGATRNYYDFKSGDGFDLYDGQNTDGTFKPHELNDAAAIDSVRNVNHFLNKMGYDLATKQADGAGGSQLLFFNAVPASGYNFSKEKELNKTSVTYKTDTNKSMGIAIQRDDDDIVLASTLDSDATFTLKGFGKATSVTYGQYESPQSNKWTTTNGKVSYKKNDDGSYTVTVPKYSVVNVSKKESAPSGGNSTNGTATPTTSGNSNSSSSTNTSSSSIGHSSSSAASSSTKKPATQSSSKKVKPFKVMAIKPLYQYRTSTFNKRNRVKFVSQKNRAKASVYTVVAVVTNRNGLKRYKLSNGHYITTNSKYVTNLYLQGKHKALKVVNSKGTWTHSKVKFTKKNAVSHLKKAKLIKVKKVVKVGNVTRYQLTNGDFVTGNKQFVKAYR